ncbi:MAG TPA: DeoR family transcriptional regulator, partial [bacterium]|nr:DeoR family transcriptional regulator [bacterium]
MARGTSGTILLAEERRNGIEEILRVQNRILVAEMAKQMKISEVTIRKDLEVLERRGVLKRVHRGAIRVSNPTVIDLDLVEKEHIHSREKDKIALKAAELIRDGEAIILDSG